VVFSKREQQLGIGVGAIVALAAGWYFMLSPYIDRRAEISDKQADTDTKLQDARTLFRKQTKLRAEWSKMKAGGLKSDPSEADSQVQHALRDWSQECGISNLSVKRERDTTERNFLAVSFHLTGSGSQSAVAKLLWAIETAPMPLRVDEVQLMPRQKEGVDDLQLQLTLSTLCLNPEAEKAVPVQIDAPKPAAAGDAKGDQL
jgi:Type II secretion system (T2SS), protein M subtype b